MEGFKIFLAVWAAVVITVLTTFGLCKLGGNLFDRPASAHTAGIDSSDGVRGCNLQGGTVVAEHGEYKECKFRETK